MPTGELINDLKSLVPAREIQRGDRIIIAGNVTTVEAIHVMESGALIFDIKLDGKQRAKSFRPLQLVERA